MYETFILHQVFDFDPENPNAKLKPCAEAGKQESYLGGLIKFEEKDDPNYQDLKKTGDEDDPNYKDLKKADDGYEIAAVVDSSVSQCGHAMALRTCYAKDEDGKKLCVLQHNNTHRLNWTPRFEVACLDDGTIRKKHPLGHHVYIKWNTKEESTLICPPLRYKLRLVKDLQE